MTEQGPDLVRFLLNLLTVVLPPLLAGVLALLLARRAPGGRGFVRTGGGLLVLLSIVQGARELWFRFLFLPSLVENGEVPVPFPVLFALDIGVHVLLAVALVLLLCAVISSRGRRRAPRGTVPRRPERRSGRPGGGPYDGGRSSAYTSNAHAAPGGPGHRGDGSDGAGGHNDGGGGGYGGGADGGGGGGGF
ncbi:hypothetical protein [Nocardiopsis dassonvillei]|uniref:hypothetical protein n=1 Tax=Nocardiopsis dassonvillei TaxID=2014 RepID=UPI000B9D5C24|nr:hypothetical protein [Nocardiopsis dassonvillei]ASU56380.1 hypothetical protein CGQ36_01935 [Nocardiopsis dassonvillei]